MTGETIDLIDIGVNLTHSSFDADRDEVIRRAAAAGVRRMLVTGTSLGASRNALAMVSSRPGLWATAGVHPHHASELDTRALAALRTLAGDAGIVAVGECGLDYFRNYSPRDAQRAAFVAQLELAADCGKPVFLHQREAAEDFFAILGDIRPRLAGGVAHCFTGGPAELQTCLELDLYVGITGWICDERRGQALREAVAGLPLERVLLETDAPYLLPRDLPEKPRGRRNEPALLAHVCEVAARYRGVPAGELARAATAYAERVFGLSPAA